LENDSEHAKCLYPVIVFGRPFVKRFALCYRTVVHLSVCLSCPVCNVGILWPNGWTDQDETWHAGRPRPRPHCVRWGPRCLSPKRGHSPQFSAHVYCAQKAAWMDQYATWYGCRPQPKRHCARLRPSSSPPKGGKAPNFQPIPIVANRLHGSRCHLVGRQASTRAILC